MAMSNQIIRREVQRCDDPFGIPACFYWTVDEVADWIESIGFGKYKENFRSHFINGRRLLTVDACTLPKLGIVHFGDILGMARCIKQAVGKTSNVTWLPPLNGSDRLTKSKRFIARNQQGNDYDYNWKLSVPEFYQGYIPKTAPVTPNDFYSRWYIENNKYKHFKVPQEY